MSEEKCPRCGSSDRAIRHVLGIPISSELEIQSGCLHPWHDSPRTAELRFLISESGMREAAKEINSRYGNIDVPINDWYDVIAAIIARHAAQAPAQTAESVVRDLKLIIERDRSAICDGVNSLKTVLQRREWLGEGRGPYEWDDDRWHQEFRDTALEIRESIAGLEKIAADLSNSPTSWDEVVTARASNEAALIAKLVEGLRKYGLHDNKCSIWETPACNCGLTVLLSLPGVPQEEKHGRLCNRNVLVNECDHRLQSGRRSEQ